MLSVAIQNRGVQIERQFQSDCECILLNGTVLARTFLDVILVSLRAVDMGGTLTLRLFEADDDHVCFEISRSGNPRDLSAMGEERDPAAASAGVNPGLQLAERTVHTCGGTLSVGVRDGQTAVVRIQLPRNATRPSRRWEVSQ